MIVDANVLLYAVDSASPYHARAAAWLTDALTGDMRVGLPWQTIGAFLRIGTHPRVLASPMTAADAQRYVDTWLDLETVWVLISNGIIEAVVFSEDLLAFVQSTPLLRTWKPLCSISRAVSAISRSANERPTSTPSATRKVFAIPPPITR